MGTSFKAGKKEVKDYLEQKFSGDARVLDVGAGSGTYFNLVGQHFKTMDACEVYGPSILKYKLHDKYRNVFHQSVTDFGSFQNYDLVIMGDVLEHLSVSDAQAILSRIPCALIVAVPFEHPQSSIAGNKAERHLQPDLTPELFDQRYPGFTCIYMKDRSKGSLKTGKKSTLHSYGYYARS